MNKKYNEIKIKFSHPNLYHGILTFAVVNIALGLNFYFTNPTFNPYGIDKMIIGTIFLGLGLAKILFLVFWHKIRAVRIVMALEIGFMVFWAVGTTITFFQGRTSLQLFILYGGMVMNELFLLLEPVVNPVSATQEKNA